MYSSPNLGYTKMIPLTVSRRPCRACGTPGGFYRIYITPVENFIPAGPDRWISLTFGEYHDDKEQFSLDGNTVYFTSNRDGFTCMWALQLDPKTKHAQGSPFAIQHLHGSQRIYSGISESNHMEVNIARDKIITNLDEFHCDAFIGQNRRH
jgi:hypothetical protein